MMWTGPMAYIGSQELLIVAGVLVLLFGASKIPQLARGMGEGIREFKKSMDPDDTTNSTPGTAKTDTDEPSTTVVK